MPLVSTPAIVLQSFPYSETSKILRLLTPSHGVCSAIAKGAQRPRSRFGGLLESFTEGEAQIHFKDGRELQTLAGFEAVRSRQAVGRNLVAFAGASLIAELVLRFGTAEPQAELFRHVSTALDRIAVADPALLPETVIADAWLVIAILGFRPELTHCVNCGEAQESSATTRFDVEGGGVACNRCRPHGRPVDPGSRAEIAAMVDGEAMTRGFVDPSLQRALIRAFLTTHLTREHALRSLDLLFQQIA